MGVQLSIITPAHPFVDVEAESVLLPGEAGEFGVLPAHERFLTSLVPGILEYVSGEGAERLVVSSGFAEVAAERVTVLVRAAERVQDIDREQAEADLIRAEQALRDVGDEAVGERRAEHELEAAHARARLKVSEES